MHSLGNARKIQVLAMKSRKTLSSDRNNFTLLAMIRSGSRPRTQLISHPDGHAGTGRSIKDKEKELELNVNTTKTKILSTQNRPSISENQTENVDKCYIHKRTNSELIKITKEQIYSEKWVAPHF